MKDQSLQKKNLFRDMFTSYVHTYTTVCVDFLLTPVMLVEKKQIKAVI